MAEKQQEILAEVAAGWSRPLGSDPRDPVPDDDGPEVADDDVLVERKDLGPDAHTRINSGDVIPATVADLPRHPDRPSRVKGTAAKG